MAELEQRQWHPRSGPYLGEISALCFLPLPSHLSRFPILLAGSGSELMVYDVELGNPVNCFHVFEGIRVHGISLLSTDPKDSSSSGVVEFLIVVFGERRVKLFFLLFDAQSCGRSGDRGTVELELVQKLPWFDHWVLDACFLKEDGYVAVGLTDNSVALWDISKSSLVSRVKSSERCLLYSMRMWGDSTKALRVASGTIYNEIIVWKLSPRDILSSASMMKSTNQSTSGEFHYQHYVAVHLSRLTGHEGSIFRISWSSDGSKLISVSDDRSARVWIINDQRQAHSDSGDILSSHVSDHVLFGHSARIWDCYLSDSIIITAGEDCTCRMWGMDGKQLSTIKEHIGRGIWRCLYDPQTLLLVTAGFDSAIKVHLLQPSSLRDMSDQNGVLNELKSQTDIFTVCAPKVAKQIGLMDSKSEYIRCMRFARENILYVATNNGFVHRIELFDSGNVRWTELTRASKEAPIICMDLFSVKSSKLSIAAEDIVAVGDGKGNATVIRLVNNEVSKSVLPCTWSAEKDRQLLGIYWCKSLGCSYLFTADPRGTLKLWKIGDALASAADGMGTMPEVALVAIFTSCFGSRIMCLDASFKEEVLICGDQHGNLTVYPLSERMIAENVPLLNHFKGAHGISAVTSIMIAISTSNRVEIHTTGGDGCICCFKYNKSEQFLEFTGMKQVKELSTIQSVTVSSTFKENLMQGTYAIGFLSADFIIWNLTNETKMLQIPCGGWRRPYSYYLGAIPEYQNCFAYMKDHDIYIHRLWACLQERQLFPKVLHMQFHGREIHSLCFISLNLQSNPDKSNPNKSCYSWVATGCEDGSVRLTRYSACHFRRWCESKLLGEHVGGSAVRSIYFTSKIYTFATSHTCSSSHILSNSKEDQFLLISVGAKQVLTSWLLQYESPEVEEVGQVPDTEHSPTTTEYSPISFQWLSTHMPPKFGSTRRKVKNSLENSGACLAECRKQKLNCSFIDQNENDWRYMAVTAFLVKHVDNRLTVCFVVVACSDATVVLRALLLPSRLWFDIAMLVPQTSPVLALQHVIIPCFAQSNDSVQPGYAYIILSGSTDGSITFWDLTETVEYFMLQIAELQPQMLIDCQRRPQTGRGSQGGRWWRSLRNQSSGKNTEESLTRTERGHDNTNGQNTETLSPAAASVGGGDSATKQIGLAKTSLNISSSEILEIRPLCVVDSVHQSGVNCLHVSEMKSSLSSESKLVYCVLSGGDDQAVHSLVFDLTLPTMNSDSCRSHPNQEQQKAFDQPLGPTFLKKCSLGLSRKYQIRTLCQDKIDSAHSSAVKGIWTDGNWAFSTGLDQRIRCWKIDCCGKLTERAHLITSVPEPESLDAIMSDSTEEKYQIAVAGRGMQMVEFYASADED